MIGAGAFQRQWDEIQGDVLAAVARVGAGGWYVLGEEVRGFEAELAAALGRKATVGVANGLDAIEIGLRVLGLQPGERVLTSPLSAFASTLAIYRAGGRAVFVDVDDCGLLDLGAARRCLERHPDIRFCLPVHLYGFCLDLDELARLRDDFGLRVVEDGAQAIGAGWGERQVGDVGQVLATSFYPTKNLGALGDGGALFTDSAELAAAARCLRDYGQEAKYRHVEIGLNSRLDELHAAILRQAMLPRWRVWNERRREIAERYLAGLDHPAIRPLIPDAASRPVWHLFPVEVRDGQRASFLGHLRDQGVLGLIHYPITLADQPALTKDPASFEAWGDLARARALAEAEVSLPIAPQLEDAEVERVIEIVNRWRP